VSFPDVMAVLNLLVLAATGAVVGWYTWETRQLRLATLEQTALQIRPFLSIEYGDDHRIWVHNIGNGVARDVIFKNVRLGEGPADAETFLTVDWKPLDFLAKGGKRELQAEGVFVTAQERRERYPDRTDCTNPWMANFRPYGSAQYAFIVDDSVLTGKRYRAAFKVHKGHTELLRDAELKADGR